MICVTSLRGAEPFVEHFDMTFSNKHTNRDIPRSVKLVWRSCNIRRTISSAIFKGYIDISFYPFLELLFSEISRFIFKIRTFKVRNLLYLIYEP